MACRLITVAAPAGAMAVGNLAAAERLALLRCRTWLPAVPVRAPQFSLASYCCRAEPLRPTRVGGGGIYEYLTFFKNLYS